MTKGPLVAHEPVMTAEVVTVLEPVARGPVRRLHRRRRRPCPRAPRRRRRSRAGVRPGRRGACRGGGDVDGVGPTVSSSCTPTSGTSTPRSPSAASEKSTAVRSRTSAIVVAAARRCAGRGFSFRRDEPLDMRMDRSTGPTAADLLRDAAESELADVIYRYGEDRYARRISRRPGRRARPGRRWTSTGQLADAVRRAVPYRRPPEDPSRPPARSRRLRIWVNRELEGLDAWLLALCRRLRAGARLAVITFHSLEDRIVKRALRRFEREAGAAIRVLTRRPLRPSAGEVARNPRARSAKLRAAERLA